MERVLGDREFYGLAPGCINALGDDDGGITGIVRIGLALGQEHRPSVRRETAGALFEIGVQLGIDRLRLAPFPFVIFL